MKKYLLKMNSDIVCIQEASADTFDADFGFMTDAGYICGCLNPTSVAIASIRFYPRAESCVVIIE